MRFNLKILYFVAVFYFLPSSAFAQITTVSGTVTDPNGLPWIGATLKAQLTSPGATVTISSSAQCAAGGFGSAPCKVPIQGTFGPVTLDSNGSFTLNLFDVTQVNPPGTQWVLSGSISPGVPPPQGFGPQQFSFTSTGTLISGASVNISSQLSAVTPALSRVGGGLFGAGAAVGPVFNVAVPSTLCVGCNAVADWKQVTDGICTNGSASISSATFGFTPAVIGKHVLIYSPGSGTANGDATIVSIQSSTTATVSASYSSGCTGLAQNMAVFTDNGPALNAAENACVAAGHGLVYVPAGIYGVVSRIWFNLISTATCTYQGAGTTYNDPASSQLTGGSIVKLSPWTPFSSLTILSFNGTTNMKDIVFDAMGAPWPNVANNSIVLWSGITELDHVEFSGFTFTNSSDVVCNDNSDTFFALDLACGANNFPGPGGSGLIVHSLSTTCMDCRIDGTPAVNGTDVGNSQFIGGRYVGQGNTNAFNFSGTSGGGKNNLISGAYLGCFGTSAANACVNFASNSTADLRDITIDNQGVNGTFLVQVANAMTVPFPVISGLRLRGAGTTPTIALNTSGAFKDGCGNDPGITVTGGTVFGSCSITGTTTVAGNIALTSGWGTTGAPTVTAGSDSHRTTWSLTVAGAPAASPVITFTFPTPYLQAPFCTLQQEGGTFTLTNPVIIETATAATITWSGTPVAGQTYIFTMLCQ